MKKLFQIISFCCLSMVFTACSEDGPRVYPFSLTTNETVKITSSSAKMAATCQTAGSMGDYDIEACGFCLSETPMPTLSGKVIRVYVDFDELSKSYESSFSFSAMASKLSPGVTYYVRAFVQNEYGVAYGNEVSFTTQGLLQVQTVKVEEDPHGVIYVTGRVLPKDGIKVYERGILYSSKNQVPTLLDAESSTTELNVTTFGEFGSGSGPIEPGVKYYARAFAKVGDVVSYGEVMSIVAQYSPEVNILSLVESAEGAQVFCGVSNPDMVGIEESGVCYGETSDINCENALCIKAVSFDPNIYACTVAGLQSGKYYYVKAYLKLVGGTIIYSEATPFTVL
jgi:hypothetical protein